MTEKSIPTDFPFESKYLEVHGSKMHYIEDGLGDPILFLHGNPTSSYLWRNIIPHLTGKGRCIAPDLIGMGKSDKPKLKYQFEDHYRYLEKFILQMDLRNITLVLHDWGSGLGFHFAAQHPDRIKGIAFMESILRPVTWDAFPKDFKMGFKLMRTPVLGWFMISVMNAFVKKILPQATLRTLSAEEISIYNRPYPTVSSRLPVRQWPLEIPIDGKPVRMYKIISTYSEKLKDSDYPKLLLYARPGGLITKEVVAWCENNLKNLSTEDIGEGLHYLQEDHPDAIGKAILRWMHAT
jgi:haloalkane dehalogenase